MFAPFRFRILVVLFLALLPTLAPFSAGLQADPENDPGQATAETKVAEYDPALSLPLLQSVYAGDAAAVGDYLRRGADPDASYQGWSALLYAVYYGRLESARLLLAAGADPNASVQGWSALRLAQHQRHAELVALLLPVVAQARDAGRPGA